MGRRIAGRILRRDLTISRRLTLITTIHLVVKTPKIPTMRLINKNKKVIYRNFPRVITMNSRFAQIKLGENLLRGAFLNSY